jgi:hypothetical protein
VAWLRPRAQTLWALRATFLSSGMDSIPKNASSSIHQGPLRIRNMLSGPVEYRAWLDFSSPIKMISTSYLNWPFRRHRDGRRCYGFSIKIIQQEETKRTMLNNEAFQWPLKVVLQKRTTFARLRMVNDILHEKSLEGKEILVSIAQSPAVLQKSAVVISKQRQLGVFQMGKHKSKRCRKVRPR